MKDTSGRRPMGADELDQLNVALSGRYRLERALGRGGMATVYLAQDLKHRRAVAIKVLRPDLALAAERFLREIEITARLTHPHILPLLDSGEASGRLYYVMPLMEGESLRARLSREGELPIGEVVRILRDVADALVYAHARGVVHRDIKPDNVLLAGRHAVVADFGVAKAVSAAADREALTTAGVALGTPQYMAPEQAAGEREIDHRADIYALGVMAYELLAGQPPFEGLEAHEVLAAHVTRMPEPVASLRPSVPPGLAQLTMRCLEKKRADRWQSAEQVVAQLEDLITPSGGLPPTAQRSISAPRRPSLRRGAGLAAATALAGAAVAGVLLRNARERPAPAPVHRQVTFSGNADVGMLSPDGQFVAFRVRETEGERLMVQQIAGGPALEVASFSRLAGVPRWSPDGSRLLFFAIPAGTARMVPMMVSRLGGDVSAAPHFGTWSPDGTRLAAGGQEQILITDLASGERSTIRLARPLDPVADLAWSPMGNLFTALVSDRAGYGIHVILADGSGQGEIVRDTARLYAPLWAAGGRVLYYARDQGDTRAVWRLEVSPQDGTPRGSPETMLSGLPGHMGRQIELWGLTPFSVSADGERLVYARGSSFSNLWLVVAGAPGARQAPERKPLTSGTSLKNDPSISPDGRWVAFTVRQGGRSNLATVPIDGGLVRQLTSMDRDLGNPVWSPDSRFIAFTASGDGLASIWMVGAGGGTPRRVGGAVRGLSRSLAWAPGPRIVYQDARLKLVMLDPATGEELAAHQGDLYAWQPEVGPGGDRVAFWSSHPVGLGIFSVRDAKASLIYDASAHVGGAIPIVWSADGRSIYFNDMRDVYVISAQGGRPRPVVTLPFGRELILGVDATPDGRRFVVAVEEIQSDIWLVERFDPAAVPGRVP